MKGVWIEFTYISPETSGDQNQSYNKVLMENGKSGINVSLGNCQIQQNNFVW